MVCTFTGARIGEVLGMKWSDIDSRSNQWTVSRTLSRTIDGRAAAGSTTKTGETRILNLAQDVVNALRIQHEYVAFRKSMSTIWDEYGDWVFPTSRGTFKDSRNLRRLMKQTFPDWKYGFHALRHWFASVGFESGMGEVQIARLLGHRSTSTTKDIYGHLLSDGSEKVIDSVQRILGNKSV